MNAKERWREVERVGLYTKERWREAELISETSRRGVSEERIVCVEH